MSFWPAKRPASAAQHRQANSLPPAHIPTICLQISKYSGEKFSLGKVFTTQHHRDVKLGERLGTRAAVREECWGFPTVTGSVGCPLPPLLPLPPTRCKCCLFACLASTAAESQAKAESLTNQQHEQEKAIKGKQVELQEAQRQLAAWQAKVRVSLHACMHGAGAAAGWPA